MSPGTLLDPSNTSCNRCIEARQDRRTGCEYCSKAVRLQDHLLTIEMTSSKPTAGHIEATFLLIILKRHAKNPHARHQALEAVKGSPKSIKPSSRMRNDAVRLVKRNADHDTPAIWLHPAEGTAPTMHYYSWCALGRPTPRGNKIYVNMNNKTTPSHRRGEHCDECVVDAWQNASLRLMTLDLPKLKMIEQEKDHGKKKEAEKQKIVRVREAFGNLRECFRSHSRREKVKVSNR
jgi:hypothetical protein